MPRVRQVPQESPGLVGGGGVPQGRYIRFLTLPRAYGKIAGRLLLGQRKNRFVPES